MAAKFIQISVSTVTEEDGEQNCAIFALDAGGDVWEFSGEGWMPLSMTREKAEPAAGGDDGEES
jgi:hypothetical protein